MRRRELTVAGAIVGTVCAILALPFFEQLELISIDALHALRYQIVTASRNTSPTVVIALDEETYRTEPFANIPKVLWTPQLARVVNAAVKAGAKVVGFDVIFPTTASTYLKGFDRDFLLALRAASKNGKAVLGKVQHSEKPIAPFPAQSFAVGHHRNIRALNLVEDSDGIVRRVPLFLASETASGIRWDPSMALELALRARGLDASNDRDRLRLGDYDVPGADRNALAINFDTAPGSIPIFSLADIYACLDRGPGDFLNAHLARKVVLIGTVLDVEDPKLTSMRLATTPNPGGSAALCPFGFGPPSGRWRPRHTSRRPRAGTGDQQSYLGPGAGGIPAAALCAAGATASYPHRCGRNGNEAEFRLSRGRRIRRGVGRVGNDAVHRQISTAAD